MRNSRLIVASLFILMLGSGCGPLIVPTVEPVPLTQDAAYHLAWSPDDRWLAASGNSGLYLIDTHTYQQKRLLPEARNAEIAFGRSLFATNDGNIVRVWKLKDGRPLFVQKDDANDFQSIAISHDDRLLVTGEQKHFRVWSLPDGALLADIPAEGFVSNLAFQDDRSLIVIVQYRALIQKWDVANKKLLHSFEIPRDVVFFTLSLDGKTMLVDYNDPGFERWDLASGKPQHYYRSALSASGWERLSGNDHFAVVWGYGIDGSGSGMSVWDLTNDTRVREFVTPLVGGDGWRAAALNADGSVLAASNDQGYVYFYGVASGQKLGQFQLPFTALSRLALPPGPAGALHPVTP